MTTNNEVLSVEQIVGILHNTPPAPKEGHHVVFARAIEQAVLAKVQSAMPANAEDTKRLNFLAEHARTIRRADNGRQNLVIWSHNMPFEGAGLRANMNTMIDHTRRRRIEGES